MIYKTLWIASALCVVANLLILSVRPDWAAGFVTFCCLVALGLTYESTWRE